MRGKDGIRHVHDLAAGSAGLLAEHLERRVLVELTRRGAVLRKRTEQMLGEFYCFLNMPLDELFDLKDRLRHFVSSAGPKELKESKTAHIRLSEPAF